LQVSVIDVNDDVKKGPILRRKISIGAMEVMYQRGKIQEESLHYERMKHTGEHPLVGVNMFIAAWVPLTTT